MFRAREVSRGRDLRPPGDSGTVKDVAARVDAEAEPGQRRVGLHAHLPGLPDIDGLYHDDMAVTSVSGRLCAADEAGQVTLRIPGLSCEALPSWRRSWPRERHCAPLKVGPGSDRAAGPCRWPGADVRWRGYRFCLMFQLSWLGTAAAHRPAVGLPWRSLCGSVGKHH